MVAHERDDLPAGLGRLVLEPIEEVEDLAIVVASVDLVSGLDDHELAADPRVVAVDGSGEAEDGARGVQIAVEIPDGDDALGGRAKRVRGFVRLRGAIARGRLGSLRLGRRRRGGRRRRSRRRRR